jgi:hypothetical protein
VGVVVAKISVDPGLRNGSGAKCFIRAGVQQFDLLKVSSWLRSGCNDSVIAMDARILRSSQTSDVFFRLAGAGSHRFCRCSLHRIAFVAPIFVLWIRH